MVIDFTNRYHWLVVREYNTKIINGNIFLLKEYGPLFWSWTIYAYLLLVIGYFLLVKMFIRSLRYYKWYSLMLIIASVLPIAANFIYLNNYFSMGHYDLTPIGLVISILIVLYGTTKLRMGELVYFTRDAVVENMKDGILLLNHQNRILDYNSVAESLLGDDKATNYRGRGIDEVWKYSRRYFASVKHRETKYKEIAIKDNGIKKIYEIQESPFYDYRNKITSNLITFRDITERKKAEERIVFLSFHDKLTGLYNRAYFEEELSRLNTERKLPLSFIIGDVNGLKLVNDAFGHREGDRILKEIAKILKENCRQHDIISRWGGDEFAILLPDTKKETADSIAFRINEACSLTKNQKIPLSLSLGVSTKEKKNEDISGKIREAEDWMYKRKLLEKKSISSSIISSLERTLQEKSHETKEHADRLKTLVVKIGRRLELSENKIDELVLLSSLHDIGKIIIPDSILDKKGPLTEKEWKLIRKHPEAGHNIAESTNQLAPIAEAILYHHEWWNGMGYPCGIKGEKIPLTARIISVADAYDVMLHGRLYKKPKSRDEAILELKKCSKNQFDPKIVEIFVDILQEEPVIQLQG